MENNSKVTLPKRSRFYHTPPPWVRKRWPGDWDWQYFQDFQRPQTLIPCVPTPRLGITTLTGTMHVTVPGWKINLPAFDDIAVILLSSGYLGDDDTQHLHDINPIYSASSILLPTWIFKPWQPIRKRRWGFGKVDKNRCCTHDQVNPRSMIHFAWNFLDVHDKLNVTTAFPQWRQYAQLRQFATVTPLRKFLHLRTPRPKPIPKKLCPLRAKMNSATLLQFDFNYGDFVRWLGGEYTNRHRDWNAQYDEIERIFKAKQPPDEYPPVRVDLAYRIQSEGAPLQAVYTTPMQATILRNEYDNHPAVEQNGDKVEEKFAKEEWKTFHLHFLRFVFEFLPGLIINPIQWAWDKGKGRICIDCTNGPDPDGSVNTYIPSPKAGKDDECPPVFFQYSFKRLLRQILRMRITCPDEPILVYADDIDAAFRRVLYHPDAAVAFSYVYGDFLMVPVGQVFGSRNAPSYYCVLADVRQAVSTCLPHREEQDFHPLVLQCNKKVDSTTPLTKVPRDSHHPPLTAEELIRTFNASYVDDNGLAHFENHILKAIDDSVNAAFAVFGTGDTRRGECLQLDKWTSEVSEHFRFLGFDIDTRAMTVSWPLDKRKALHDDLVAYLKRGKSRGKGRGRKPPYVSPREMARIIGQVRSASAVAPWGTFLSFNLQNSLNAAAKRAFSTNRRWWNKAKVYLSPIAIDTIKQLLDTLLDDGSSLLWSRPIALYLDRDYTHSVYSDASYGGIGGWSVDFSFLWRLTRDDLEELDFDMKPIRLKSMEPVDAKSDGLHINPLEYVGALVNLWLTLKCVMKSGPREGGYILELLADNTTALSWMSLASRTKNPQLQGLARLGSALLVEASRLLTKVCPVHIPGEQNVIADALSRPPTLDAPTQNVLDSVIAQWSPLAMCRICLLPSTLLTTIASVISSPPTGDQYGRITTKLLTLEPNFLPIGVRSWESPSTIYDP